MFKTVRYLNPRGCDRITDLIQRVDGKVEVPSKLVSMIAALAKIKPDAAKEKLETLLNKLEKQITKDRFNLILKGIPDACHNKLLFKVVASLHDQRCRIGM